MRVLIKDLLSGEDEEVECLLKDVHMPAKPNNEQRALMLAVIFCLVMAVVEGVFGLLANSLAILSDAVHMLADVFALSISLFALYALACPATASYTYGWKRVEVVGALCSVFTTWALVAWILFGASSRIMTVILCAMDVHRKDCELVNSKMMFGVGIFGFLMNIALAAILHFGGAHAHSHGSLSSHHHGERDGQHSHAGEGGGELQQNGGHGQLDRVGSSRQRHVSMKAVIADGVTIENERYNEPANDLVVDYEGKTESPSFPLHPSFSHHHESSERSHCHSHENMNIRAAMLHVLCDCLQSIGVVVAGLAIWAGNSVFLGVPSSAHSYFNLLDPLLSVLFSILALLTTRKLVKEVWVILLEQSPSDPSYRHLCETLERVDKVEKVEDLHVWSIGPGFIVLTAHLRLSECILLEEANNVVKEATWRCANLGVKHTTIQLNIPSFNPSVAS